MLLSADWLTADCCAQGSIERFCEAVKQNHTNLRILVNNACQTVSRSIASLVVSCSVTQIRRPAAYYAPLVHKESEALSLEASQLLSSSQTGGSQPSPCN